ncbi:MAG TPA: hypothetical protein VF278_22550 [Pirellulales bacterium]
MSIFFLLWCDSPAIARLPPLAARILLFYHAFGLEGFLVHPETAYLNLTDRAAVDFLGITPMSKGSCGKAQWRGKLTGP